MSQKVLSYDLGGTKVAVGVVNSEGKVLDEIRVPVVLEKGKDAVINQLADLGQQFLGRHQEIQWVGMASAGPLHPGRGELLDPTNMVSAHGTWGKTPLTRILKKKLSRPVFLENDAAAAALAEHWIGAGKEYENLLVLTLGTGLGTGIICNGKLVRSGHGLHPEGGHMIIKYNDSSAPCGCGNLGCAEAYLAGRSFGRRAKLRFADPNLKPADIAELARKRDPRALAAFEEYAEIMAIAIHNYVRLFAPEVVIFTGSFAAASDLFIPSTQAHLERLLLRQRVGIDLLPKLTVSTLDNTATLIGGAYVAFLRKKIKVKEFATGQNHQKAS